MFKVLPGTPHFRTTQPDWQVSWYRPSLQRARALGGEGGGCPLSEDLSHRAEGKLMFRAHSWSTLGTPTLTALPMYFSGPRWGLSAQGQEMVQGMGHTQVGMGEGIQGKRGQASDTALRRLPRQRQLRARGPVSETMKVSSLSTVSTSGGTQFPPLFVQAW